MRRFALGCLVTFVGMAGVFVYDGVSREREFQRLIAEGDQAALGDQPFLAIEAYSGALTLKPESMAVHLKRGETYQRQGDLDNAERDLSRAARLDPTATRPWERLGDAAFARQDYARAVDHYTQYVRLEDQSAEVLYKLALANERDGRVNRAVPLLRQAVAVDPKFVEAHYLLGLCLREQERLAEARDVLRRAIELSPGFLLAREVLAAVHRGLGERREELRQLDALAALDRTRPERHVARALAYAQAGQTDMAVLALGRAAEEHPDQPQVYGALGRVWLEIAESGADRVALSKALEALRSVPMATASSDVLTLLGRALLFDGDAEGARRVLELAVSRFPVAPDAFLHLAWVEEADRNFERGNELRQSYQRLTGASPSADPAGPAAELTG